MSLSLASVPSSVNAQANITKRSSKKHSSKKSSSKKEKVLPGDPKDNTTTTSILHGPLRLSFKDSATCDRATKDGRPKKVYRWSHEHNGTLASNVSRIKHRVHPDNTGLKLKKRNAFEASGTLKPNLDFTNERFGRHFNGKMTANPTPFISTTSVLKTAEKRVIHLHDKSRKAPRCLVVTAINIGDIVPATLTADLSTTIDTHDPENVDSNSTETKVYRGIEIPIWVLDKTPFEGRARERPDCVVDDVLEAGGLFWFSVNELKESDLRVWAAKSHMNEWLAVSSIPKSLVTKTMPYDGAVLHTSKKAEAVRARRSPEPYYWNYDKNCWDHKPDLTDYRPYRLSKAGDKRIRSHEHTDAIIAGLIVARLKRARGSGSEANSDSEAQADSDDEATLTPDSI
ncbi:hypothetical protein BKA58DRAFT_200228 [Alternaria rosae]|uniref:uncharacterized protein n=1 Tax=Alternaria rosae TaxID=1187941 RepID=UPI001E8E65FF|nr:uncharacterized protein BKA58DRAFT_200228 [Alternaria rosae]KAH6868741.1 hypothetical protein BKA58DRAFT_200228 [Alternaria rosae]